MERKKPYKGQIVYSLNVGDGARSRPQRAIPVVVTKVGRKYFTTAKTSIDEQWRDEHNYHIDTWHQVYGCGSATTQLFESKQEYEEEQRFEMIKTRIRMFSDYFRYASNRSGKIPLSILEQIDALIAPYFQKEESK